MRRSPDQDLSPELEYTIDWFESRIVLLDRLNAKLESSLFKYQIGFWAMAIIALGMVLTLVAEVLWS